VSVALHIQHEMRMRHIVNSTILEKKNVTEHKKGFDVFLTVHLSIFILVINQIDSARRFVWVRKLVADFEGGT